MRDLPAALVAKGLDVTVLTPSYGAFHTQPGAHRVATLDAPFRGHSQAVDVHEVPGSESGVRNLVFEHAWFSPAGPGRIYSADDPARPFATDASKFALFCAAAAAWIDRGPPPDVVHLHDWHSALYLVLRAYHARFERLRRIRTVFTIHNLSYQGMRPISGDESSLEAWYPDLRYTHSAIRDPHLAQCVNPMAAAIRLADRLSTVSPTYAGEICEPSNPDLGFIGGEGLEQELGKANREGRLVGILNGCEYRRNVGRRPGWQRIVSLAAEQVDAWLETNPASRFQAITRKRLAELPKRRPKNVLTSIGRVVRQKAALFLEPLAYGRNALEHILDDIGRQGVLFLLGSGEPGYEHALADIAERTPNLVYLCGYSETLADPLYRAGDLFLMPSSFEPCGISQMLAMRSAQPCVVHGVGGLRDTVRDERTGFVFNGATPRAQADAFVATVRRALALKAGDNDRWQSICIRAASQRFTWRAAATQTIGQLYDHT